MEEAINNIRTLCPQDFKLASPGLITQVQHFGLTQQQFLEGCSNTNKPIMETDAIAIPTFHGNISLGHWYLTIITKTQGKTNGYILDSLGHSQEQTMYVHNVLAAININVMEWTFYPTILQYELECGPRVVFHLCDIIDQLRDGVHIEFSLSNMSQYNISRTALSAQSRMMMYNAIHNNLNSNNLVNFVANDDDDMNFNQSQRRPTANEQPNPTRNDRREHNLRKNAQTITTPRNSDQKSKKK